MRARLPYLLLALLVVTSIALHAYRIEGPCADPCTSPGDHGLIWDESYYVNAARTIAGIPVPERSPYLGAPAHRDPNAEHPQLAKLAMAAGLEVFGNRPIAWRFGSLVAGTVALLLLFALVRAAGGSPWLALGATAVMAVDNLAFVHGRIATLDMYALMLMLGAALAYVRGRPVVAGLVLGVGMCAKLVSFYLLFVFGLLELGRWWWRRRSGEPDPGAIVALARCIVVTGVTFVALLAVLDVTVKPWDGQRTLDNPVEHTRHILRTATALQRGDNPEGAASYPWEWVTGRGDVDFLSIGTTISAGDRILEQRIRIRFRGEINPFLIMIALPALFMAGAAWWRRGEELDLLALAWFLGFFIAFCLQSLFEDRAMYIHYMLAIMPALYIAGVRLFAALPRAASVGWGLALVIGFIQLYPFRDVF